MQKAIEVTMRGMSPLLMHRFPEEPIEAIEKKTPEERAEFAAYRIPDTGELYVPGVAVQRALVGAATFSKGKGRGSLQKQTAACVLVTPEHLGLGTKDYTVDARPVVNPMTKGRMMGYRPRLDEWVISFTLEYDDALLSEKQLREIVDNMGRRVGLLDFRPEKKGPFGRCVVVRWEDGA